jgi:diguanylate cyclase (GGDEF)-like protein/PAS domain S-box-containing protein
VEDTIQQQEDPLQGTDGLFRQIVEETWEMLGIVSTEGNQLLHASAGFDRIIGFIPTSIEQLLEIIDSEYRMDARKLFYKAAQTGARGRLELRAKRVDGSWVWLEAVVLPIKESNGQFSRIAFVCNDLTIKKTYEHRLVALAYHDPLTGLPNRRLFKELLSQALSQAKRTGKELALLYLDIDDFKQINDTMGHDIGDQFLQEFANRVRGCLREIDTFARMGGDEFTILLPSFEARDNVEMVAKRIFRSLEKPWNLEQHQFKATISMGIVMYPEDGTELTGLLKQVDKALYQVKGTGRNRYQFYQA